MALTYKANDAFEFSLQMIKGMNLEDVKLRILDQISKMLWMAAPWRWTVGATNQITLASNTVSYTLAPPADYLYSIDAYAWDGIGEPQDLIVVPSLPTTPMIIGSPSKISYEGSDTFRVFPKPGTLTTTWVIQQSYKKTAPALTLANIHTAGTLLFPDEWSWVYEAGVLWLAYLYADDQRAGGCQVQDGGRIAFSGQRAAFEAGISQMKEREPLYLAQYKTAPNIPVKK